MFDWIHILGLHDVLNSCRDWISPWTSTVPPWVKYSLPDGLWAFSLSAFMRAVWIGSYRLPIVAPLTVAICAGVLPEVAQAFNLFPGTFDPVDLAFCSILGIWGTLPNKLFK